MVNPAAGAPDRAARLREACGELQHRFLLDIHRPPDVASMTRIAGDAAAAGATVIVAGGDGSVNLVANAIAPRRGTMGILPLGTANDLARELGIPRDSRLAGRAIAAGSRHQVDLVSVNGRRFVTVGGLGVVADTAMAAARLRAGAFSAAAKLARSGIYRLAAAGALLRHPVTAMRVTWHDADSDDERMLALDAHGVFVTNHATCGGGLVIPTAARGDDGVFEIALVPRTSRASLLSRFTRLSLHRPLGPGAIIVLRATSATIETEKDRLFVADGEPLSAARCFTLGIEHGAIGVIR